MSSRIIITAVIAAATSLCVPAQADWKQMLDKTLGENTGLTGLGSAAGSAALSNDDIIGGLKEALAKGAQSAVNALGRSGGYLNNSAVKIQLPDTAQSVSKVLKAVGQGRYADEFVQTMNSAAESAVPEAGAILGDAIRQMSVADAREILDGPQDAATQYFRRVGEERLTGKLRPIVSDATSRAGVTSSYKNMMGKAGPAASLLGSAAPDLDGYVTTKALDGLFLMIAAEEKRIRENPVARTSELLKKVFGASP
ncbi:MAG: hypothetical protein ACI9DC_001622 [Gammaproteobacteria bacterium]|jgi:hypothetical protein